MKYFHLLLLLIVAGNAYADWNDSDGVKWRGLAKREDTRNIQEGPVSCDLVMVRAETEICEKGCQEFIYTKDGIKIGHIHYNRRPDSAKVILCSDVVKKLLRGE